MRLAIMQPYFCPYIGYFQLINAVDEFVVYDNIEYTKKGWINRNRILVNGQDSFISLPLKKDSDFLDVKERSLADSWDQDRRKLLNKVVEAYRKAPYFKEAYPVLDKILMYEDRNLFNFIFHSIVILADYLGIETTMTISSAIDIDHSAKGADKVIALCKARNASIYINPIGGLELYKKDVFSTHGIELRFLRSGNISYPQFGNEFVPFLSIIDVIMFNSRNEVINCLANQEEL